MSKLRLAFMMMIFCIVSGVLAFAQNNQLVIYTWEDMFPPEVINEFQRTTGIRVVLKYFEENEEMLDELIRTNGGEYDLVVADDYIVQFITHPDWQLAQKLDKYKISNIGNVDPIFTHQFYDAGDEYTIPYGAGVQTIVYNPSRIQLNIRGYADLWNSALRNSVGIVGNYRVINGMALKTLGKSYNTNVVADIRDAGQRLLSLAPNIRTINDTSLDEDLIAGRISAAIMYTDQAMRARQANPNLRAVYPAEGIGFGIMPAFIPSRAPNPDAAHRFLNFILDPARGARCFEYLGYYCTFKASQTYIRQTLREFLIMPDFGNVEMIQNVSQEAEDEHDRIWAQFIQAVSR